MKKKLTALVLQGGGALGAYELGVIKALYEEPNFSPDIISGVSIGAFSAAVLAGAKTHPVTDLEKLWELLTTPDYPYIPDYTQLLMSMAYNKGMYFPNPKNYFSPLENTHFYNTQPLFKTLAEVIDFDRLNSKTAPKVILTATNIATGNLDTFTNFQKNDSIDIQQVIASGSMPPSFPMMAINNQHYWDGGLFSNTPLKPAIKQLQSMSDDSCEREIILVDLFPKKGALPENMPDVYNRMFELTFESKISADIQQVHKTNQLVDLFANIESDLDKNSKIKQSAIYQQMRSYKKIDKISIIRQTQNDGDDLGEMIGTADFREQTISKRIKQGYEDAKMHLTL